MNVFPNEYDGDALAALNDELFGPGRPIHPLPRRERFANTGELYVSMGLGGIWPEGEMGTVWALTPEAATQLLKQRIQEYAKDRPGVVYWRAWPQLDTMPVWTDESFTRYQPVLDRESRPLPVLSPRLVWIAYCRLLISDKPETDDAAANEAA